MPREDATITEREVEFHMELLKNMVELGLKERLMTTRYLNFPIHISRFLFFGKGSQLGRGIIALGREDFPHEYFQPGWDSVVLSPRGTQRKIIFPLYVRFFLARSPLVYEKRPGSDALPKKRRYIQRLMVSFKKETINLQ